MCREIILELINGRYNDVYSYRYTYTVPERKNPSPIPEREAARQIEAEKKAAKQNPYKWPVGFDFSSLSDEDLVLAFERIVRVSSKQM